MPDYIASGIVILHKYCEARQLYTGEDFGLELDETIYALDSSTINLCLSIFSWTCFKKTKSVIISNEHFNLNSIIGYRYPIS